MLSSSKLNALGLRWVSELADFNFTIKYHPGKANADADMFSRVPLNSYLKQCTEEVTKETSEAIICAATLIGHNNSNWVSALTNNPNILLIDTGSTMPAFSIQPSQLLQAQMEDKSLGPVINYLKSNHKPPSHLICSEHQNVKPLLYEWSKLETRNDDVLIRNN